MNIKKLIFYTFLGLILLQLTLIAHRVNFSFNTFSNFYIKNIAIKESVRDYSVVETAEYIKKNKLKDFTFKNFENSESDESFKERLISFVYPIKFFGNSKNIISKEKIIKSNCKIKLELTNVNIYEC